MLCVPLLLIPCDQVPHIPAPRPSLPPWALSHQTVSQSQPFSCNLPIKFPRGDPWDPAMYVYSMPVTFSLCLWQCLGRCQLLHYVVHEDTHTWEVFILDFIRIFQSALSSSCSTPSPAIPDVHHSLLSRLLNHELTMCKSRCTNETACSSSSWGQ